MRINTAFSLTAAFAAIVLAGQSQAQQMPNMAGNYRCQAQSQGCDWSGQTFTVTQTGNALEVKNDKGDTGTGTLTSNMTISMGAPWNMFGVISNNNREIEWSNGTQWQKQ